MKETAKPDNVKLDERIDDNLYKMQSMASSVGTESTRLFTPHRKSSRCKELREKFNPINLCRISGISIVVLRTYRVRQDKAQIDII